MPQAIAIPIITGAATLGAGAIGYAGAKSAAKSQERSSSEAIALAREQEAEKKRQWEIAQQAAKYQWEVTQANLAPYRAARAAVLSKYGINTSVDLPPMPPGYGGVPATPGGAVPAGIPGAVTAPYRRYVNPMALGRTDPAMASQVIDRGPAMAAQVIDRGPEVASAVRPEDLSAWSKWSTYGVA